MSPDHDGYPEAAELERLATWPLDGDPIAWLEYARSLWWARDWGWDEFDRTTPYTFASTGGWSGNEEIVRTMQSAHHGLLWGRVFYSVRRGGHYTFVLDSTTDEAPPCPRCAALASDAP